MCCGVERRFSGLVMRWLSGVATWGGGWPEVVMMWGESLPMESRWNGLGRLTNRGALRGTGVPVSWGVWSLSLSGVSDMGAEVKHCQGWAAVG